MSTEREVYERRIAAYLDHRRAWMEREVRLGALRLEGLRRDAALHLGGRRPSLRDWIAAIRSLYFERPVRTASSMTFVVDVPAGLPPDSHAVATATAHVIESRFGGPARED